MKLLKKIGIGLLVFIALLLILAAFLPKELNVESSQKMDAPANYVYNIVNDLKNVPNWDPWVAADETMSFEFADKTMGEGASYSWNSENSGSGELKIVKSTPGEHVSGVINSPQMGEAFVDYTFLPKDKGSEMKWNFKSKTGWPMNLMNFFIKRSVKGQFKKGLDNISAIAKDRYENATYSGYQVKEEMIGQKNYVISRGEVSLDKMQQFFVRNLSGLFQKIQKAGVEMSGKPSALVYSYDMVKGKADMAAGIPISEELAISDAASENIPAGKAVVVNYYGDPQNSEIAHMAIDEYLRDRGLFHNYPVIEETVTDSEQEKDPEKWLTRVIYYLAE